MKLVPEIDSPDDCAPLPPEVLLVGTYRSDKFHTQDCEWFRAIRYTKYFVDEQEARSHGYAPCAVCNPVVWHRWILTSVPPDDIDAARFRRTLPQVHPHSLVTLRFSDQRVEVYKLGNVSVPSRSPAEISNDTALARAVTYRRQGDTVRADLPGGSEEITILKVE